MCHVAYLTELSFRTEPANLNFYLYLRLSARNCCLVVAMAVADQFRRIVLSNYVAAYSGWISIVF